MKIPYYNGEPGEMPKELCKDQLSASDVFYIHRKRSGGCTDLALTTVRADLHHARTLGQGKTKKGQI